MKLFLPLALAGLFCTPAFGAIVINEFEPNPVGADPSTVSFEIAGGTPGGSFDLWVLSLEADFASPHFIDRATNILGTFDVNGFAVASIPDFENPSFTAVLTDTFTGVTGNTIDSADIPGSLAVNGINTVIDAIGIPDSTADEANIIGAELGGADFVYSGDEPKLVFRDGITGDWYAVNDQGLVPEGVFDINGNQVPNAIFDADPEISTFGTINPSIPEPSTALLGGLALLLGLRRRR